MAKAKRITLPRLRVPNIPCDCCDGRGVVPLQPHLHAMLETLAGRGEMHAEQFMDLDAGTISSCAYSNRLRELLERGYLTRRRKGKFWLYKITGEVLSLLRI